MGYYYYYLFFVSVSSSFLKYDKSRAVYKNDDLVVFFIILNHLLSIMKFHNNKSINMELKMTIR